MPNQVILTVGNEKRELLHFDTELFYPHPNDQMFISHFDSNPFFNTRQPIFFSPFGLDNKQSIKNKFSSEKKYRAWENDLLEGYDRPRDVIDCYRINCYYQPFDGLLNIIFESTDHDDFFYYWFKNCKIQHGVLDFYNAMDKEQPMRKIEFWDGYITQIEEHQSAYSHLPMYICCTISAATLRYNKSIIFRKNWYMTEIDQKSVVVTEQKTKRIRKAQWINEQHKNISNTDFGNTIYILIDTENYSEGESVVFMVKDEDTNQTYQLEGKVDASGRAKIEVDHSKLNQ